eukprot:3386093-Prymnesium_polylepis.1
MRGVESRTAWRRRTEARVAVMWSYASRNPMMSAVAGVASGIQARSGQTRQQMGHEWRKAEV